MADILSQEEIDAFLSATGDLDYDLDDSHTNFYCPSQKMYREFVLNRKRFKHDKLVKIESDFPVFVREGAAFQRNYIVDIIFGGCK